MCNERLFLRYNKRTVTMLYLYDTEDSLNCCPIHFLPSTSGLNVKGGDNLSPPFCKLWIAPLHRLYVAIITGGRFFCYILRRYNKRTVPLLHRNLARSGEPFFAPLDNFWASFRDLSKDGVFVHTS
jgi:hypothetical protein